MRIRLDPAARAPLSSQLRDAIAARVRSGGLLPEHRLPAVRELAAELGLAPNTVAKAYRELEAEGYLIGRGRHGTFVAGRLPEPPGDADERLREAARAYARRARQLGFRGADAVAALDRAIREP